MCYTIFELVTNLPHLGELYKKGWYLIDEFSRYPQRTEGIIKRDKY